MGFWSTGYRVLLDESAGWNTTNVFSKAVAGTNYDNYTWRAAGKTYSFMIIRDGDKVYAFYENLKDEYIKVYDSAAAGHTFAATGKCAYGFAFSSSKSFNIEFRNVTVLTDELAEEQIAKYVG